MTLPAPGASGSLSAQKAIVIQTLPPVVAYGSISPVTPGSIRQPVVTLTVSEAATVTLYSDNVCSAAISSGAALITGAGQTITTYTLPTNAATSIYAKAVAAYGNTSSCTSMVVYTHDNIAPR